MDKNTTMLQLFQEFDQATKSMEELKLAYEALKRSPELENVSYTANDNGIIIGEVYQVKSAGSYTIKSEGVGKTNFVVRDGKNLTILYEKDFDDTAESEILHLTVGDKIYFHASADPGQSITISLQQQGTLFEAVAEELADCERQFNYLNSRIDNLLNVAGVDEVTERIEEVFQSVSDGKTLIANAIADKGIPTDADATFAKMAANIHSLIIEDGIQGMDTSAFTAEPEDIVEGKTAGARNQPLVGRMPVMNPGAYEWSNGTLGASGHLTAEEIKYGANSATPQGTEADSTEYLYMRVASKKDNTLVRVCTGLVEWLRAKASDVAVALGISADVIPYGKTFCDIDGTYTYDGTVEASKMLENEVAYSKGQRIIGSMPNKTTVAEHTSTPALDTTNQEVKMPIPSEGFYNTSNKLKTTYQTLASLIGLSSDKLAKGNTMLGVTGSTTVIDTSSYTASDKDILKDYTAGVKGNTVKGTMNNNGDKTLDASGVSTDGSAAYVALPSSGFFNTGSKLKVALSSLASALGITASKIVNGVTICGVSGTAIAGGKVYASGTTAMNATRVSGTLVYAANATGEFSTNSCLKVTINHNLGIAPTVVVARIKHPSFSTASRFCVDLRPSSLSLNNYSYVLWDETATSYAFRPTGNNNILAFSVDATSFTIPVGFGDNNTPVTVEWEVYV